MIKLKDCSWSQISVSILETMQDRDNIYNRAPTRSSNSTTSNNRECYLLQAFLNESFSGGTSTVLPYIHQCAVL